MAEEKNPHDLPTWVFPAALAGMLVLVTLGTVFWMWRDTRPRRRPAMLGAPDPVLPQHLRVNATNWTNGSAQ